jgi:hypothetical protein
VDAEPIASLTDFERKECLRHLGYTIVSPAAAIGLGIPSYTQPAFLAQMALNNLPQSMVGRVREHLAMLDQTERNIFESQKRLKALSIGDIRLRDDEPDRLLAEYAYWGRKLASMLGCPVNALSEMYGGASMTIPIAPV